ncbi:hypothetical protein GCM10009557_49690 [Virgisporangium ochraceum]|uniref:SHOCT domain-containing protein n=1 Tax=Virgisporangium ochraceum TaxID=65505 RepID=A0A8J3ZT38_9ACTN|nr:SHOCT domain-containing protein [Virgisporangium ochraceum]GIJ68497.1 hypothetical protein Voc01_034140 [Virgisporangium ochraceum]
MGLLRGIARTAVVAGTATAVSNRVTRRQAVRAQAHGSAPYPPRGYGGQYPPPGYPPPPPPAQNDLSTQLAELTELHDRGVLDDQEFAAAKAKLLGI